jgi:hypothetical protein
MAASKHSTVSKRSKQTLTRADKLFEREAYEIRELERSAEKYIRCAIDDSVKIGRLLKRVKDGLPHGKWLPWVKRNYHGAEDRAEGFMRLAAGAGTLRFRKLRNLPVPLSLSTFGVLMSERVPEQVIDNVVARSRTGERVTTEQVRQIEVQVSQQNVPIVSTAYVSKQATRPLDYLKNYRPQQSDAEDVGDEPAGNAVLSRAPNSASKHAARIDQERLDQVGAHADFAGDYYTRQALRAPDWAPVAFVRLLEAAAAAVGSDLPSAQELANAARVGKTPEALTASALRKLAALFDAFATELDYEGSSQK